MSTEGIYGFSMVLITNSYYYCGQYKLIYSGDLFDVVTEFSNIYTSFVFKCKIIKCKVGTRFSSQCIWISLARGTAPQLWKKDLNASYNVRYGSISSHPPSNRVQLRASTFYTSKQYANVVTTCERRTSAAHCIIQNEDDHNVK